MNPEDLVRTPMKMLDPNERIKNFDEVECGYTKEEAIKEANRCLQCKVPQCTKGCPVGQRIPEWIKCIREDNLEEAYKLIDEVSALPAICGRVCPQEQQCEKKCVRGVKGQAISIGALERYVADHANRVKENAPKETNGKKIAIIGSGPSGLTCAVDLARLGYDVTIYEALHRPGGVLAWGIPEFRLPNRIVDEEIDLVKRLGVKIIFDTIVGRTVLLDDLEKEYDAIYIANGANVPKFMGIPGEDGLGVMSANELLIRVNLMDGMLDNSRTPIKVPKIAYVIGGGNVAMDAARTIRRFGAETHVMYRRSHDELPALGDESIQTEEEGVIFDYLTTPIEIIKDSDTGKVKGMKCIKYELGEKGIDGRSTIKEIPNSEYEVVCDQVIYAISSSPNNMATRDTDILHMKNGLIFTNNYNTTIDNVYAGGDTVTGPLTVIKAMEAGRKSAKLIDEKLKNNL